MQYIPAHEFGEIIDNAIDPMLIIKGNCFYDCNDAAVKLFKLTSKQDCKNIHPWQVSPEYQPDGAPSIVKASQIIAECYKDNSQRFFWMHQNMAQQLLWVEVTIVKIIKQQDAYIHVTIRDIRSQLKELNEHLNLSYSLPQKCQPYIQQTSNIAAEQYSKLLVEHKRVIDKACIVSKTDINGIITYVNDNFCQVSGYEKDELIGQNHNIISHPDVPKSLYAKLWQTITKGNVWQGVIKNKCKNGGSYIVKSTIAPIYNASGAIGEFIAIRYDITDLYNKEHTIAQQRIDNITRLQNNVKLANDLKENGYRHIALFTVADLIDIQSAYYIEEYHQALLNVAKLITSLAPKHFHAYRYSENIFAITIDAMLPFNLFLKQLKQLQTDFTNAELVTNNSVLSVSSVLGVAPFKEGECVLSQAKMALLNAEEKSLKLSVYDEGNDIHNRLMSTIAWTQRLKSAMLTDGIAIFGQKIFDGNQQVWSTEVLMRYYCRETNSYISPNEFLTSAKKAKIYPQLTQIIVKKAFSYFACKNQHFSINISRADIDDKHTSHFILAMLSKYQLGSKVTIELVESENYDMNDQVFLDFLYKVKQFECLIAIDDFGSGYSNFEYITKLPIDIIKIDGSLVRKINEKNTHQVIVKTIVDFSHALNFKVIAEFVSNNNIYQEVNAMGADLYQGYYFHEPQLLQ